MAGQMAMIGLKGCHAIIACTMHDVYYVYAQREHILSPTVSHINTYQLVRIHRHRNRIESSAKSQMERNNATFSSRNSEAKPSQVHKCIFCQVIHFEFAMPFNIETFIPTSENAVRERHCERGESGARFI